MLDCSPDQFRKLADAMITKKLESLLIVNEFYWYVSVASAMCLLMLYMYLANILTLEWTTFNSLRTFKQRCYLSSSRPMSRPALFILRPN
jgi:hypothetical protein